MLAELAVHEPYSFKSIFDRVLIVAGEKAKRDKKIAVNKRPMIDALKEELRLLEQKESIT